MLGLNPGLSGTLEALAVWHSNHPARSPLHTEKKENKIFLIYKEIQSGAVAKSYMRKGFLIYEEMRKYFLIYEEAVSHIWLCNCSVLNFLTYEENFIFFFIRARMKLSTTKISRYCHRKGTDQLPRCKGLFWIFDLFKDNLKTELCQNCGNIVCEVFRKLLSSSSSYKKNIRKETWDV